MVSNSNLFCSYYVILSFFKKFELIMEQGKMKVFYFSKSLKAFEPPSLNLMLLGGSIFWPKNTWHYLRFIFDQNLTFWQYINFYANKTISTIKCIKILGNLSRDLILNQMRLLQKLCFIHCFIQFSTLILQQDTAIISP